MLQSKTFTFNPFQENTYVLYSESGSCVIVDPGCYDKSEQDLLLDFVNQNKLVPQAVWLTHAHIDHVLGLKFCVDFWKIPYYLHELEVSQLKAVESYAPNYGFHDFQKTEGGQNFDMDTELKIEAERFQMLFVPGHAPGHVAFYHPDSGQVWAGDVLFKQSIGRTDLPGGDYSTLEQSIKSELYSLPENTIVYPGHGPSTTIGYEKFNNQFVRMA